LVLRTGKSAIAAAIQLCLGMTATKTGRGKDVAGYIREGSPGPAICEVTLLNEGSDAHEPEAYGPRIIVRRMIFKNASSTYQLLSAEGKVITPLCYLLLYSSLVLSALHISTPLHYSSLLASTPLLFNPV
jgi:hypothetical protein